MRGGKRSVKTTMAGIFIAAGLMLFVTSLVMIFVKSSDRDPGGISLPGSIGTLDLNTTAYGSAAIAEITQMHGQDFRMDGGAVGRYGQSNQVILWVASFSSISMAEGLVSSMEAKIAAGGSPFTPIGVQQEKARMIYHLDGMGQKHVYFQSGSMVIWLSADPSIADQAIQQVLVDFP